MDPYSTGNVNMWYVHRDTVEQGFALQDTPPLHTLVKYPQTQGSICKVQWYWVYNCIDGIDTDPVGGGFTFEFLKPKKGFEVDPSSVSGTIEYDGNRGTIVGVMQGQSFQGNGCWNLNILWETTEGRNDLGGCKVEVGTADDPNGYPYLYVALGPAVGTHEEPAALIAKRDTNNFTFSERQALGLRMTGKQFQRYMSKKIGKRIKYESESDDDYTDEEYYDGRFEEREELETDDEWQMDGDKRE